MRAITLKTKEEKTRDVMYYRIHDLISNGRFCKDYELRDIVLSKWEQDEDFCLGFVVSDDVELEISITATNKVEKDSVGSKLRLDSEMFPEGLMVPNSVRLSMDWKEDSINRYKIVKLNFEDIKGMIREGKDSKDIEKRFGIPLTEKECENLMKRDHI